MAQPSAPPALGCWALGGLLGGYAGIAIKGQRKPY